MVALCTQFMAFLHGWSRAPTQRLAGRGGQQPPGTFPTPFLLWVEKPAPDFSQKTDVSKGITSPGLAHDRAEKGTMPGAEGGDKNMTSLSSKGLFCP